MQAVTLFLIFTHFLTFVSPQSYTEYDNGNYVGVWAGTDNDITWYEALQYCNESMGTVLASIHSETENTLAISAAIGTGANISTDDSILGAEWTWIGLNDINDEGTFTWVDGTDVNYTNWAADQPASTGGAATQDCVHYWKYNQWADRDCNGKDSASTVFVCNRLNSFVYSVYVFFCNNFVLHFFIYCFFLFDQKQTRFLIIFFDAKRNYIFTGHFVSFFGLFRCILKYT